MAYTKPQVVAQNSAAGSYAAGCPARDGGYTDCGSSGCRACERTKQRSKAALVPHACAGAVRAGFRASEAVSFLGENVMELSKQEVEGYIISEEKK